MIVQVGQVVVVVGAAVVGGAVVVGGTVRGGDTTVAGVIACTVVGGVARCGSSLAGAVVAMVGPVVVERSMCDASLPGDGAVEAEVPVVASVRTAGVAGALIPGCVLELIRRAASGVAPVHAAIGVMSAAVQNIVTRVIPMVGSDCRLAGPSHLDNAPPLAPTKH